MKPLRMLGILSFLGLAASCMPNPVKDTVDWIGDSNSALLDYAPGWRDGGPPDMNLNLNAIPGSRLRDHIVRTRSRAAWGVPEKLIVALGTNDVLVTGWKSHSIMDLHKILEAPGSDTCIVVVLGGLAPDHPKRAELEAAHESIRAIAAERPNTLIADWSSMADEPGIMYSDGVHLATVDGIRRMANIIWDKLKECGE